MGMATDSYLVSYKAAYFLLKTKYWKKDVFDNSLALYTIENENAPEIKVKVLSLDSLWKEICNQHYMHGKSRKEH